MDYSKAILRGTVAGEPTIQRGREVRAVFQLSVKRVAAHKKRVDVHKVVAFGAVADSCRFLRAGCKVIVEGRPQIFEGQPEVVAESIIFDPEDVSDKEKEPEGRLIYRGGERSPNW